MILRTALLAGRGRARWRAPFDQLALSTHRHHLCRARHYCHEVGPCAEGLHAQVERLVQQAGSQADASVALYYFNASLYLLRVLKGNTAKRYEDGQNLPGAEPKDSEVSPRGQPTQFPENLSQPLPGTHLQSSVTCILSYNSSLTRPRLPIAWTWIS